LIELIKTVFSVLKVNDWRTFDYEEKKYGTAKIERVKYKRGLYLMEGVSGYDFFYVTKPIMINVLKINDEEVMNDDPLHYYGMKLLADESKGRDLTAGLGLGLYTIFLQSNTNVESVTVIELNNDIKQLVEPMIRKYIKKPTQIIIDDIMNWKKKARSFDTIMLDIWAINKPDQRVYEEMLTMFTVFKFENPNANVYIWGFRDPSINPAVLKINKKYINFAKSLMGPNK